MLTQHQVNGFKDTLERRFREAREHIRQALLHSDEQSYIELAGRVHDMEEESVADLLVDVSLADIDRHVEEVRDIDAALGRIAIGSYGICSECGEAMDAARLEAYPTAKRCRPCQEAYEKRRPVPPHSTSL
jgi:RNA polymerase-binding transcription factor DksA